MCTFMGKGAVARQAPYCLFTVGLQAKDLIACAIDAADLVICLGYDLVEYHPQLWNKERDKRIIHVDFQPAEIDQHYHPEVEIVGDLAHALWMLNERNTATPVKFDVHQHKSIREQMLADFSEYAKDTAKGAIKPQKAIWDARSVLGPSDIVLSDVGAHKMWVARYFQCDEPNTCLISNGFCSMGFALPGAIGAKLAFPERRVLSINGDGGFLMNLQEMETARRVGANIVCMVWEDKGYGLIKWKQDNQFGHHTMLDFDNPDFTKLADAFGWDSHYVADSSKLRPALEAAFQAGKPSLVVIPIDYSENNKLTKRLGDIACPI
jgi:acetolactate synthase-1/2/3 large subunit